MRKWLMEEILLLQLHHHLGKVLVNFSKPTDHHQSPRYCICWEGSPSTWTFKPHQLQPYHLQTTKLVNWKVKKTHIWFFNVDFNFKRPPTNGLFLKKMSSLFGETNILLIHFQVTLDTYSRGDRPKMFFVLSVLLAQILILEDFALVTQVDKVYICSILYIYTNITNLKTPGMPIHFWEDFPKPSCAVSMKFTQILCNISSYLARTIFSQSDLNKPGVIFIGPKRGWKHPAPRCNIRFFVVKVI